MAKRQKSSRLDKLTGSSPDVAVAPEEPSYEIYPPSGADLARLVEAGVVPSTVEQHVAQGAQKALAAARRGDPEAHQYVLRCLTFYLVSAEMLKRMPEGLRAYLLEHLESESCFRLVEGEGLHFPFGTGVEVVGVGVEIPRSTRRE